MAGCSVVLLMILISPLLFGLGIVLGALFVLKLAFDAVVGTIALPLLVVSIACGITATAIVVRMLWLHFHDHQELDLPGMLVLPAVLTPIFSRLDDQTGAGVAVPCPVRDHCYVRAAVDMEFQHLGEIDVVDRSCACQKHIFLVAVFDKIQVVVNISKVAGLFAVLRTYRRQIEKPLVVPRQIPILA